MREGLATGAAAGVKGRVRAPDQLGERIRKARHELGLSLAAVAQKDFSRAFLNQVELGRSRPSTRTLQIIVFALVMGTGPRVHARIGGLRADQISVHDGQR